MSSREIPIQNIYHMLCYAWGALEQRSLVNISRVGTNKPVDLLAKVLVCGIQSLLRRGIARDYVLKEEVISGIRGKPDLPYSARRLMLRQGRVRCEFDELSMDILANQILLATLKRLYRISELDKSLFKQLKTLIPKFSDVQAIKLHPKVFKSVRIHSNNRFYRFLMSVCELIYQESLLHEKTGNYRFRDFHREGGAMARLFEKFILNFYKKEQGRYSVASDRLKWRAFSEDDPELNFLPFMYTDISLWTAEREVIIDAKYYLNMFASNYDKERIRSGHIYQINSYLENTNSKCSDVEGILLYPEVDTERSLAYSLNGKKIRIETIDLSAEWYQIEKRLLELVGVV